MAIIPKKTKQDKRIQSFRLRSDLVVRIEDIALKMGESKTYVIEKLLEYALNEHEKEVKKKNKQKP